MEKVDYDYEPKNNSPYLSLKSKGDKCRIRLVSTPIHFTDEYKGQESERFAWIVLDKTDMKDVKVRGFKAGVMIYVKIKKYAMDPEYGDPTKYDLKVERTEEQGNYYSVTAAPFKSELSSDEIDMIKEANIDLEKLFATNDKGTKTYGKGGAITANDSQEESDEINIDDIPFK